MKAFVHKRAVAQPMTHAPAEFSFHCRKFKRESPVIEPLLLNACAVVHFVRAEQLPGFGPLSAEAVEETVQVRCFRRQLTVLVPRPHYAMKLAIEEMSFLLNLAIPIEKPLDVWIRHKPFTSLGLGQPESCNRTNRRTSAN